MLKQEIRVSCDISLWLALPHWRSLVRPRSGSTYEFVQDWFRSDFYDIYLSDPSIPIQILTRYSKYSPSISFVHFPSLMRQGSRNRAMRNSPGSLTWFIVTGTIAPSHAWSIWTLLNQIRQPVNLWNVTPHSCLYLHLLSTRHGHKGNPKSKLASNESLQQRKYALTGRLHFWCKYSKLLGV